MLSKLMRYARPGAARSATSVAHPPAEVIRGFVAALARCEAALTRPTRQRGRRRAGASLDPGTA